MKTNIKFKVLITSLAIFSSTSVIFPEKNIQKKTGYVIADGGLNLREKPNQNSKIIGKLDNGIRISWDERDEIPKIETVSGLSGKWTKLKFKEKTGYFFNGFISRIPSFPENFISIVDYLNKHFKQISKIEEYEFINNHYQSDIPENQKLKTFREIIYYENNLVFFTTTSGVESSFNCLQSKNLTLQELYLISKSLSPFYMLKLEDDDIYSLVNGIAIKSKRKGYKFEFPNGEKDDFFYMIHESGLHYLVNNLRQHLLKGNEIFIEGYHEAEIYSSHFVADTYAFYSSPVPTICFGFSI